MLKTNISVGLQTAGGSKLPCRWALGSDPSPHPPHQLLFGSCAHPWALWGEQPPPLLGWQISHRGSLPLGVQFRAASERQGREYRVGRCAPVLSVVRHVSRKFWGCGGAGKGRAHQRPDQLCCGLQPVRSPRKLVSLRSCNLCPSFNSENYQQQSREGHSSSWAMDFLWLIYSLLHSSRAVSWLCLLSPSPGGAEERGSPELMAAKCFTWRGNCNRVPSQQTWVCSSCNKAPCAACVPPIIRAKGRPHGDGEIG